MTDLVTAVAGAFMTIAFTYLVQVTGCCPCGPSFKYPIDGVQCNNVHQKHDITNKYVRMRLLICVVLLAQDFRVSCNTKKFCHTLNSAQFGVRSQLL